MGDDFDKLEPWLREIAERLTPGRRQMLATRIGRALRTANVERMAKNVDPDGAEMAPRKERDGKGAKRGRMFRKLAKARAIRIRATADEVELAFAGSSGVGRVAAEHHFGKIGFVGRDRRGGTIRTRYPERRLLGITGDDREEMTQAALDFLAGED